MSAAEDVLASVLLLGSTVWPDVRDILRPEHFPRTEDRRIWEACEAVAKHGDFNELTVREHMGSKTPQDRLSTLTARVPSSTLVAEHAKLVRERAVARELTDTLGRLQAELRDDPSTALDRASSVVSAVCNGRLAEAAGKPLSDVIGAAYEKMAADAQRNTPPGIPTSLASVDQIFKGFRPGKLTVLAARPGVGKTALALQAARNVARTHRVYFASLEMDDAELGQRLMSSESRVEFSAIADARVPRSEAAHLSEACNELAKADVWVEESARVTVQDIRLAARKRGPLGLIVVDYLQLVQPTDRRMPREQQVSEMSREFKLMAKELGCGVLLLAQLNREVEKGARKPRLSDLRESGAIEQDADCVMFIHRDTTSPTAEIIIAKQRSGGLGIAEMAWRGNVQRFESIDPHREAAE